MRSAARPFSLFTKTHTESAGRLSRPLPPPGAPSSRHVRRAPWAAGGGVLVGISGSGAGDRGCPSYLSAGRDGAHFPILCPRKRGSGGAGAWDMARPLGLVIPRPTPGAFLVSFCATKKKLARQARPDEIAKASPLEKGEAPALRPAPKHHLTEEFSLSSTSCAPPAPWTSPWGPPIFTWTGRNESGRSQGFA